MVKSEPMTTTQEIIIDDIKKLETDRDEALKEVEQYKSEANARKEDYARLIEDLAKRLNLPVASDRADILGGVDRLLEVEEKLRVAEKALTQEEKKHELEKSELQDQIKQLREEVEKQQRENNNLLLRMNKLDEQFKSYEKQVETTKRWATWINNLQFWMKRPV